MTVWCRFEKPRIPILNPNLLRYTMASKRKKLTSKKSRRVEEPSVDYDHEKFVNVGATKKFGLISQNRSFIKEKGFYYPDDFFKKTITNKGWRALC